TRTEADCCTCVGGCLSARRRAGPCALPSDRPAGDQPLPYASTPRTGAHRSTMAAAMGLVALIIVLAAVAVLVSMSLRIVNEYERLVVFRLGRCIGARGPGPIFLLPFVDQPTKVDLRE